MVLIALFHVMSRTYIILPTAVGPAVWCMDTRLRVQIAGDESIVGVIVWILWPEVFLITDEAEVYFQWVSLVVYCKPVTSKNHETTTGRFVGTRREILDNFLRLMKPMEIKVVVFLKRKQRFARQKKKTLLSPPLISPPPVLSLSHTHTHSPTATFLHLQLSIFITSHLVSQKAV